MSSITKVAVTGFHSCKYFQKAKSALLGLQELVPSISVEVIEHPTRDVYREWWFAYREKFGPRALDHSSSPSVWINDKDFIGGADATIAWIRSNYMAGSSISKPPRVLHENDLKVDNDGSGYDYDLIVIGGGSGGLSASKEAALLGAKVVLLDYVKPSWQGSTWGLGGTCVNVGCIPKKLMHTAALLGESLHDAEAYGWDVNVKATHDWAKLTTGVQDHISSLNFGYRVQLREKAVEYKNALGSFIDPHTVELTDKKGKKSSITGRRILVAVGGRPKTLDIPGGELAISSDDLFSLDHAPGKTLVIGASYVALECAGFLAGLKYDVSVMVRSILLRGFDSQISELIGTYMAENGTRFIRPATPSKIEKLESGKLRVTYLNNETNVESQEEFDTVFVATGRVADTGKLNLDKAGVSIGKDGKIETVGEQTNVPHIYAIGDVLAGRPELTPVAIAAGKLLAKRLFGKSSEGMDYDKIPTTVFTPLEYGTVGFSEEDANTKFGAESIEIYHAYVTPLEWTVGHHRPENKCYAKIVVNKADNERIVGFHILGPHAGEVTQGWACALRLGATYESFRTTVGIHPTLAEEFTTLDIPKSSGKSAEKSGC
jgi:thioredoxin reductase (NADPH)